ncbi:MAG: sugar phosphate isomerase/epimerase [Planctomycetes bacterium]|nr:sugar phosphate isomerase/epimerase [Planctomycetota bacterium]
MSIENRIGVSTISMIDISIHEAIRMVGDAGFKVMEIWAADFQGVSGMPLKPASGIWPRTCSPEERRQIKEELAPFDTVIIHVQLYGTDIAAINPGIREESQRQYIEALELGLDLGASHVTYHHGSMGDVLGADGPERARQAFEFNVQMARTLVDHSEGTDMLMGYENGNLRRYPRLIEAIDSPRFGLLLDIPHAVMASRRQESYASKGLLEDIDLLANHIVEVHAHGLWADVCVLRDHQDVRKNNCLDYGRIMPKLRHIGYDGPFIFEICAPDAAGVVERSLEFREALVQAWEESEST